MKDEPGVIKVIKLSIIKCHPIDLFTNRFLDVIDMITY